MPLHLFGTLCTTICAILWAILGIAYAVLAIWAGMCLAICVGKEIDSMTKVYSVTLEVKLVVKATSREEALLSATEQQRMAERLQSLRVLDVFCPAEGK